MVGDSSVLFSLADVPWSASVNCFSIVILEPERIRDFYLVSGCDTAGTLVPLGKLLHRRVHGLEVKQNCIVPDLNVTARVQSSLILISVFQRMQEIGVLTHSFATVTARFHVFIKIQKYRSTDSVNFCLIPLAGCFP